MFKTKYIYFKRLYIIYYILYIIYYIQVANHAQCVYLLFIDPELKMFIIVIRKILDLMMILYMIKISKNIENRSIKMNICNNKYAKKSFELWSEKIDKIEY